MIKVGLTGNIGSGKSLVAGIFEVLGVPVYHADAEAKRMLEDPVIIGEVTALFGDGVLAEGQIDRKKLATIVFNDKIALDKLNGIVHPYVRKDLERWIGRQEGQPYILQEAAILFESGFNAFFDKIIVVTCPVDVAITRVMKRDNAGESDVRARMANQWPEQKKADMADYLINNDGAELVIPQVLKIHKELTGAHTV